MVLHDGINIYEDNKDAMCILVKIIKEKSNRTCRLRDAYYFEYGRIFNCRQNKHMRRLFITLSDCS